MSDTQAITAKKVGTDDTGRKTLWQRFLLYPTALTVMGALIGAIPTGIDLYKAFEYDIGYTEVKHAEEQRRLWMKNFACAQSMVSQAVSTAEGIRVQVGACPNGDVLIEVVPPTASRILEWISLERIRSASMTSSLSLIGSAHALGAQAVPSSASPAGQTRVAQANTVCQKMQGQTKIIRVVNQNGKCFREEIDVLKGKVVSRKPVPCNTGCG